MGCRDGHPHPKKTFSLLLCFFSLVFFHISILVLNGLLKPMMNIMIKLLLFLLKSKRFCSVIVGEGCRMGGVGFHGAVMFFRERYPVVQTCRHTSFGIKILKQSSPPPSIGLVFAFTSKHLFFLNSDLSV